MATKNEKVLELYEKLAHTEAERKEYERNAAALRDQEKELKAQLAREIPPQSERAGIYHNMYEKPSVKYAQVIKDIHALVPKTKWDKIQEIKEKNTTSTEVHTFKLLEQE